VSAKNIYHDEVCQALITDGWTITHDPMPLACGRKKMWVDLGAERPTIAAEREGKKIAVEIQSFLAASPIRDLQEAVGQYCIYRMVMEDREPERTLYMAVTRAVYEDLFSELIGQLVISRLRVRLVVFDEKQKRIVQWID
jgi:hypothetical protein